MTNCPKCGATAKSVDYCSPIGDLMECEHGTLFAAGTNCITWTRQSDRCRITELQHQLATLQAANDRLRAERDALKEEQARLHCLIYDAMQVCCDDEATTSILMESGIDPNADCPTCEAK